MAREHQHFSILPDSEIRISMSHLIHVYNCTCFILVTFICFALQSSYVPLHSLLHCQCAPINVFAAVTRSCCRSCCAFLLWTRCDAAAQALSLIVLVL